MRTGVKLGDSPIETEAEAVTETGVVEGVRVFEIAVFELVWVCELVVDGVEVTAAVPDTGVGVEVPETGVGVSLEEVVGVACGDGEAHVSVQADTRLAVHVSVQGVQTRVMT